jgi:hypothetical protein
MLYTRHKTLTDNTEQSILTIPSGFVAHVKYVFVANHGGSTNQVDLFWETGGVPDVYIFDGTSIGSGGREILGNSGSGVIFVLSENETVKAQASSGTGSMEIVMTIDLLDQPPTFVNFNGA